MRQIVLIVFGLCALLTVGCQSHQGESEAEVAAVERVVYDLFESIASFNYPSIREHCTEDVVLFEDGQVLGLEAFIDKVKVFEGKATINYHLEDVTTHVEGSFAWLTLRNRAVMVTGEGPTSLEWLESAVLQKQAGLWRIAFYHSTAVRDSSEYKRAQ